MDARRPGGLSILSTCPRNTTGDVSQAPLAEGHSRQLQGHRVGAKRARRMSLTHMDYSSDGGLIVRTILPVVPWGLLRFAGGRWQGEEEAGLVDGGGDREFG
jgi:hypothetical protein